MGFLRRLFGTKGKRPTPKAPAADNRSNASAKDVVRQVFDELARGRSHDQIRQTLIAQGLSMKNADDYIGLVEKTMFNRH
tara:strand:+ start:453 stop:692 length:240 start_codon:yes stop_codon:yes gene_type:complete